MKTILVTAYDVDPYKGSESGMGWNFIGQIARTQRVIAVTRENNRPAIERYIAAHGSPGGLEFRYYDLPKALRFWKRGSRGSSLYFYLWQLTMPLFVRATGIRFDVAHNLNFHADWAPSMLWIFGKPFVWGPVGHHGKIPKDFVWGPYGPKAWLVDRLKWAMKRIFWLADPFLKLARRRADVVLCMNTSVAPMLGVAPGKALLFPSVGTGAPAGRSRGGEGLFRILSVGRFVPLKGFDIALSAFASLLKGLDAGDRAKTELVLVGKGPEKARLEALAAALGVADRVRFIEWMDKERLSGIYSDSSVFLFPSHEGAGMVVAEALSYGLPVVCLDNDGPGEFVDAACGRKVPYGSYAGTVAGLGDALLGLFRDRELLARLSEGAYERYRRDFDWDAKGRFLARVYAERT